MQSSILYKKVGEKTFTQIESPRKGAWLSFVNPTEIELKDISTNFGLDFSIIADCLDPYEMPRIEVEDNIKYIFVRFPIKKAGNIESETALIVISEDYFITFSKLEVPIMPFFETIDINTTQKTKMFIEYLSAINQLFNKQIQTISKQIRSASSNIEKLDNKDISRFVDYERVLNDFLSILVPVNMMFERILYGKLLRLYEQDEDLVQDLSLGTAQLIESCKLNMRYLVNIREAYSTILSNNLNRTMKMLTSLTVLLTIPTIIYSFFGMNVILPFADKAWAALGIILLTAFVMILLVVVFIRGKLLK